MFLLLTALLAAQPAPSPMLADSGRTISGVNLPGTVEAGGQTLSLNGAALPKKSLFKVYVAALYVAQTSEKAADILAADAPRRMEMHFVCGVDKKKICEAWDEGLANNTPDVSATLKEQFVELCGYMADIKDGQAFTFTYIPGTGTALLTNVNFATGDGGFVAFTPVPSGETDWAYSGTAWWSPGQATALGGNNITYLTNGAPYVAAKAGVASLSFTHRHSFEVDWDGGVVQVSINGGPFATVPSSAFIANGYNGTLRADTGTSLAGQRVFFGNSAGHPAYITSQCLLAGVQAGDTVVVQFVAN